jgi:ferredoxin-thioredoxin reductase catalytic subunit
MEANNEEIEKLYNELDKNARNYGYLLNPDEQFAKELVKGLIINTARYGYQSCPCRLSEGKIEKDRDIICPCDYRDPDLNDFGACYCGLYVSQEIYDGKKQLTSIPERRNTAGNARANVQESSESGLKPKLPVWRCRVCGYLCARENPPEVCPICKAKKDRFERFL